MLRRTCAVALAVLATAAPAASAHLGSPNYLSQINAVSPAVDGLSVDVLSRDDRLLLRNTSGRDVVIEGYDDEPYARVLGDGTVEVNEDSPALYRNDDRFGDVSPPAAADGEGALRWRELSRTGRFEWHDHRMHWMSQQPPERVREATEQTTIFDWSVPVAVDGRSGAIAGTLLWTPQAQSGPPTAAVIALAAVLIAACIVVAIVLRRRAPAVAEEAW